MPVNYASILELNQDSGLLKFKKFNTALDIFITLKAFDGLSWSPSNLNPQIHFVINEVIVADLPFELPIITPETE